MIFVEDVNTFKKICVLEVKTGTIKRNWEIDRDNVKEIKWYDNSKVLERTAAVKVWNTYTGKLLYEFSQKTAINSMAVKGNVLATISAERIRFWNLSSREMIKSFPAKNSFSNLVFHPSGNLLASYSNDHLALWDVSIKKHSFKFVYNILSAAFDFANNTLTFARSNKTKYFLWDMVKQKRILNIGYSDGIAVSPNRSFLKSTENYGRKSIIWDLKKAKKMKTFKGTVQFLNNKYLIQIVNKNTAKLWDIKNEQVVCSLSDHLNIEHVVLAPKGRHLAILLSNGVIKFYNLKGKRIKTLNLGKHVRIFEIINNKLLSIVFKENKVFYIETINTISKKVTARYRFVNRGVYEDVVNRKYFGSIEESSFNLVYANSGKRALTLDREPNQVTLSMSPKNRFVAGLYNPLKIWNIATGKEMYHFKDIVSPGIIWHPGGWRAIVRHSSQTKLLNLKTGKTTFLKRNFSPVFFGPGHKIVVMDKKFTVRQANLASKTLWRQFFNYDQYTHSKITLRHMILSTTNKKIAVQRLDNLKKAPKLINYLGYSKVLVYTGNFIALHSTDKKNLQVYNVKTCKKTLEIPCIKRPRVVFFSPNGLFMGLKWHEKIEVWNCAKQRLVRTFSDITACAFYSDGILLTFSKWAMQLWDIKSGKCIKKEPFAISSEHIEHIHKR